MKYSREKPHLPGWYWVRGPGDQPGVPWEAIVRIDRLGDGLFCSWLHEPGRAAAMHESQWNPHLLWCGPLPTPALPKDLVLRRHIEAMLNMVPCEGGRPHGYYEETVRPDGKTRIVRCVHCGRALEIFSGETTIEDRKDG